LRQSVGEIGKRPPALDIKAGANADDRAGARQAKAAIQRQNDQLTLGRDTLWSPTIRAALLAGTPARGCGKCPRTSTMSAIRAKRERRK
jgi:hypothetical protein